MAAIKDTLLDKDENEIYPKTVTDNVFDSEGNRLDNVIGSIKENLEWKKVSGTISIAPSSLSAFAYQTITELIGAKEVSVRIDEVQANLVNLGDTVQIVGCMYAFNDNYNWSGMVSVNSSNGQVGLCCRTKGTEIGMPHVTEIYYR